MQDNGKGLDKVFAFKMANYNKKALKSLEDNKPD